MRCALLLLVACGGATPAPSGPAFAVIEYGAEPRSVLRYETAPNATERFALTQKVRTTTKYENTVMEEGTNVLDLPGIRVVGTMTATAVSPNGDADVQFVVEDATVLQDVLDQRVRQAAASSAAALRGVRGGFFRASSGEVSTINAREGTEDVARNVVMFPREPIGIGARWSHTNTIEVANVRWYRSATFTLRDRTNDTVTIDVETELRAGEQVLHAEPNATTRLTGGTGRGSGHLVISLQGLGVLGKVDEQRTVNVLITRGRLRVEAAITAEAFVSYDAP